MSSPAISRCRICGGKGARMCSSHRCESRFSPGSPIFAIMPEIQALRKGAPIELSDDRFICFLGHGHLSAALRTTSPGTSRTRRLPDRRRRTSGIHPAHVRHTSGLRPRPNTTGGRCTGSRSPALLPPAAQPRRRSRPPRQRLAWPFRLPLRTPSSGFLFRLPLQRTWSRFGPMPLVLVGVPSWANEWWKVKACGVEPLSWRCSSLETPSCQVGITPSATHQNT